MQSESADALTNVSDEVAEHAVALVRERTKDALCPMCDTRKWLVESKPSDVPLRQLLGTGAPAPAYLITNPLAAWEGLPTIPCAMLTCANCGFVRLHNISYLTGEASDVG